MIAGSAGLRRGKYDLSMQIGARLFERIRSDQFDAAVTECSTCRMQIEHGAAKPAYHPLHLLARAAFGTELPGRIAGRRKSDSPRRYGEHGEESTGEGANSEAGTTDEEGG